MYTRKPTMGKFQGNSSEMLAKAVYNASMDGCCETLGDDDTIGFYAYVQGKRHDYILKENSQGFVYVEYGPPVEMKVKWAEIASWYAEYCEDSEECDELDD